MSSTETTPRQAGTNTGRNRVWHAYPCYQREGRLPAAGDKTYCGIPRKKALTVDNGVPLRGNEHLACVVCVELASRDRGR